MEITLYDSGDDFAGKTMEIDNTNLKLLAEPIT
jgi:hypothetical protein